MATNVVNSFPVSDRWSYLWLILGTTLGLVSFGEWTIPLAPWLLFLCLIRFSHTQKTFHGFLFLSLARMGLATFLLGRLMPSSIFPAQIRYVFIMFGSLSGTIPYLADRIIAPRLKGVTAALVFPVTFTAWEFFTLSISPMGTFTSPAYSQYGNLPFMQLVSITGLAGMTFMMCWFGSTFNWCWERSFSWPAIQRQVAVYGTVMGCVILYGGARLVFQDSTDGTMRITSFSLSALPGEGADLRSLIKNDRSVYRKKTRSLHDRYLDETRRQADFGAQLILWPEAAGNCAREDEQALIKSGQQLAREKRVYLAMPLFTQEIDHDKRPHNKLVVFDPQGDLVLEHYKYGGNQFEGSVLGDGELQTFQTPSTKVGAVICWDMDFPRIVSQSGRNGTDILLAPANDWEAVSTTHAYMAVFRAIENGVSLVRHAKNGLSIATDPYGRTLATMDHFTASERLMIAQVPTKGVTTVYSVIGDSFAWVTVIAFLFLVCMVVAESRRSEQN